MDRAVVFHRLPRLHDAGLAEIFAREVLRLLVGKRLLSPERADWNFSWWHTGFNAHSRFLSYIHHLEFTFAAEKPPPAYTVKPVALLATASAEESGEYE
jgi:hypothetical protein